MKEKVEVAATKKRSVVAAMEAEIARVISLQRAFAESCDSHMRRCGIPELGLYPSAGT